MGGGGVRTRLTRVGVDGGAAVGQGVDTDA